MNPAVRYGALLRKDVQKHVFARVTGIQQVVRASSSARFGGEWTCRGCRKEVLKKDEKQGSLTRWNTSYRTAGKSFTTSARASDNDKKGGREQDTPSPTIHLQPPPPREEQTTIVPPAPEPALEASSPQPDAGPESIPSTSATQHDGSSEQTTSASETNNEVPPTEQPEPAASSSQPQPNDEPLSTPASRLSSLPSAIEKQRWDLSRRLSTLMDSLLTKATLASQQINTYTGTDFSGIEALRTEIVAQEKAVKAGHLAVSAQKDLHMEAHVKQASSQKEIVSLLERKSSWSPSDLERYMTLVRSEHLDEQAVQKAKEDLAAAERDLEDSRALLERLERKQYHEEQIWSDTIRRNSTWVTIGLMGVNIFLLLAQIIFFEPYRRRKIVREVKEALDERVVAAPGQVQSQLAVATPEVEKQVDEVVEPKGVPVEAVEAVESEVKAVTEPVIEQPVDAITPEDVTREMAGEPPIVMEEVSPVESMPITEPAPVPLWEQLQKAATWEDRLEISKAAFHDLFSERAVQLKQVDVTTIALQGAASGVAAMGLLFLLLRPQ